MFQIERKPYGSTLDNIVIEEFTLKNSNGLSMTVINYGGIITRLSTPDSSGKIEDITLGYDSLQEYEIDEVYFGALVGRYGNRIANGKFLLNDKIFQLPINKGHHHLHGGPNGFHRQFWKIEPDTKRNALSLSYLSRDGEGGYPGNLEVNVSYQLTEQNELVINYKGSTDQTTIFNPTQHIYFNLTGNPKKPVTEHLLEIRSRKVVAIDDEFIPTGELETISNGPLDFSEAKKIGLYINDESLINSLGYDNCYVLDNHNTLKNVAQVIDPVSRRQMEVFTTSPGMQFYSGNLLEGTKGKNNVIYPKHAGFCLETQLYPDSPNHASFPKAILNAGESFEAVTIYKFGS